MHSSVQSISKVSRLCFAVFPTTPTVVGVQTADVLVLVLVQMEL